MRILALTILSMTTPLFAAKPKPSTNPADYPLTVQVNCTFLTSAYNGSLPVDSVHIGVTLDGKPMELIATSGSLPFAPGSYKARLAKDSSPTSYEIMKTYELLLPDGKTRNFSVSGVGRAVCGVPAQ